MSEKTVDNGYLSIWEQVKKTDPAATKRANANGQTITSINAIYMARRATEMFGPIGTGWGYSVVNERFDKGGPVFARDTKGIPDYSTVIGHESTHTIHLRLWYLRDGQRAEVEQFGHTPYIYWSHKTSRFITDGESPKKSLTDAMKKCLSLLGFSADIFEGLFDDQAYVQQRTTEAGIEKADDQDKAIAKAREEFAEWVNSICSTLELIPHPRSIELKRDNALKQVGNRARVAGVDGQKAADKINRAAAKATTAAQAKKEPSNG